MAHQSSARDTTMFRGAVGPIDFSIPSSADVPILPLPQRRDSLITIATKMKALARVANDGKSIAVATWFVGARDQVRDPELLARMSMRSLEWRQYQSWKNGVIMPKFDWVRNREIVPGGDGSHRRFTERAQAMATIYNVEDVAPENAAWLYQHMSYAIPLVRAVVRVARAEKHIRRGGGLAVTNWMELAEAQTARKAVAVSTYRVNEVWAELRKLEASINQCVEAIEAREHIVRAKQSGLPGASPWTKRQMDWCERTPRLHGCEGG